MGLKRIYDTWNEDALLKFVGPYRIISTNNSIKRVVYENLNIIGKVSHGTIKSVSERT